MQVSYANPTATATPGYCPQEAAYLRARVLKTWLPGSCLLAVVQIVVTTAFVALDLDLTQEAPEVIADLSGAPRPVLSPAC